MTGMLVEPSEESQVVLYCRVVSPICNVDPAQAGVGVVNNKGVGFCNKVVISGSYI